MCLSWSGKQSLEDMAGFSDSEYEQYQVIWFDCGMTKMENKNGWCKGCISARKIFGQGSFFMATEIKENTRDNLEDFKESIWFCWF